MAAGYFQVYRPRATKRKGQKAGKNAKRPGRAPAPSKTAQPMYKRPKTAYPRRPKREGQETGYPQWSMLSKRSGRKLPVAQLNKRVLAAAREPILFGFRGVKNFDDNGYYPINSQVVDAVYHQTPCYAFLLNGINRTDGYPLKCARRLYFDANFKQWKWTPVNGLDSAGAVSQELQLLHSANSVSNNRPDVSMGKALFHDYTHIKLNCWGAKTKAVRWSIQVLQPLDDEVNPYHWGTDIPMNTVASQAWEEMMKQYTYNPIVRIDHNKCKSFKVIKNLSFIIEPISTTESDQDPHVKTINWFIRFNRVTMYDKATISATEPVYGTFTVQDPVELKSAVDTANKASAPYSNIPRDKQNLILVVRCSDYTATSTVFSSETHGSFDLDFKTKYIVTE